MDAEVIVPAIERFGVGLADEHIAEIPTIEVGMIDAVSGLVDREVAHAKVGNLGAKRVMHIPDPEIPDDKGMRGIGANPRDSLPEVDSVQTVA